MTDKITTLRVMTKNRMSDMFAAEKANDAARMEVATNEYTALCAALAAVEKMTPKKPRRFEKPRYSRCPSCNGILSGEMYYCDNCGQALVWKED